MDTMRTDRYCVSGSTHAGEPDGRIRHFKGHSAAVAGEMYCRRHAGKVDEKMTDCEFCAEVLPFVEHVTWMEVALRSCYDNEIPKE